MGASRHEVARILRDAATLLRTKGWTQGEIARDASGYAVDSDSPYAACYCSLGAIAAASKSDPETIAAEEALALEIVDGNEERLTSSLVIQDWNDEPSRTVDGVVATFERAAARAEGR